MGSWSVSCGISSIAITSGNECCIIPLKESRDDYGGYVPTTLPIFGKYNDYGGMENIVEDENTRLIENHLGITIAEFIEFLVDGKFTYDRDEVEPIRKKLEANEKLKEISKWRFMWIDKQVYKAMSKNFDKWEIGHHDYGTPDMLSILGFKEIEGEIKNYDPDRFNKKYQKDEFIVYSDGNTMLSEKDNYIFYTNRGCRSSLETYMELPDDLKYFRDKINIELWKIMSTKNVAKLLSGIFGDRYWTYGHDDFEELLEKLEFKNTKPKPIYKQYFDNLDTFGDLLVGINLVRRSMHPMSSRWFPHVLYLTPQCGEYRQHQILLEEFARINKSYIDEE